MPFHVRSIGVGIAVIFFFVISLIGWISGLSPFTCCKRALVGTALAYIAGTLAVKAISAILMNSMISDRINQNKEKGSGGTD